MIVAEKTSGYDSRRKYKAEWESKKRALANEISIPPCVSWQRRGDRLADPVEFIRGYFWPFFENPRPINADQKEAIETIVRAAKYSTSECIVAPRGDWKTETAKALIIYLMLAEITTFPLLVCATGVLAGYSYTAIKDQFENNDLLFEDFPEVCLPARTLIGAPQKANKQTHGFQRTRIAWTQHHIILPSVLDLNEDGSRAENYDGVKSRYGGYTMTYRGLDSGIRGINIRGHRPSFALIDDPETEESARQDGQIDTRTKIIDKAIGGLRGGGKKLTRVILGTLQNSKCLTKKKLDQWGGKRYQGVYKWPKNIDLWDEYIDIWREEEQKGEKEHRRSFQFYVDNQEAMNEGVEVASEENFDSTPTSDGSPLELTAIQHIYNEWAEKGRDYVLTEIQNDPPEEQGPDTSRLTAQIVMSRISGLQRREFPPDTDELIAGIDLGKRWHHWASTAWTGNSIGRVTDYGVIDMPMMRTDTQKEAIEIAIYKSLHQWRDEMLAWSQQPDMVLIDAGEYEGAVYRFILEVGRPFVACRGRGDWRGGKTIKDRRETDIYGQPAEYWYGSLLPNGIWLYHFHDEHYKLFLQNRWLTRTFDDHNVLQDGSLSLFVPSEPREHTSFAKQQVAEIWTEEFQPGKKKTKGFKPVHVNNHWLDAMKLCCVGANMRGIRLQRVEPKPVPKAPPKSQGMQTPDGRPFLVSQR